MEKKGIIKNISFITLLLIIGVSGSYIFNVENDNGEKYDG